jgi:hypothetical protein
MTVAAIGCKKDDKDPDPEPTTGTLATNLGYHWGVPDLELGETYTDASGHAIQFDTVKFFISAFRVSSNGSWLAEFPDKVILADATEEALFDIGTMAPGSFDAVQVVIGLDSTTNHADPATAATPLNDMTMHTGSTTTGYDFLLIEGRVDDDGTGVVDADDPVFSYRCSTDSARRELTAAHSGHITAGESTYFHMHLHVDELLDGVDMLVTPTTTGYSALSQQLMDRMVTCLEVE